jgi:hypothetical protein
LPRRVRQANLSPHLRGSLSSGTSAGRHEPETRSPEQAQSLLASLQSGWERGRRAEVPGSEATVSGPETAGDVRIALDLDPNVPALLCDARQRDSVKDVLITLVQHVLTAGPRDGHQASGDPGAVGQHGSVG